MWTKIVIWHDRRCDRRCNTWWGKVDMVWDMMGDVIYDGVWQIWYETWWEMWYMIKGMANMVWDMMGYCRYGMRHDGRCDIWWVWQIWYETWWEMWYIMKDLSMILVNWKERAWCIPEMWKYKNVENENHFVVIINQNEFWEHYINKTNKTVNRLLILLWRIKKHLPLATG